MHKYVSGFLSALKRKLINLQEQQLTPTSIKEPLGTRDKYLEIFEKAKKTSFPSIDNFEKKTGFAIQKEWIDDLALHTQVCIKKSKINYCHGRILYSILRNYLSKKNKSEDVFILETGTARGFSSICMSKAVIDSGCKAKIMTIDLLPHKVPMYWNCVDDLEGKKTREDLLTNWNEEKKNILFINDDVSEALRNQCINRINFAFIDATHDKRSVMLEYNQIQNKQNRGDIIVFDDVTSVIFEGVTGALKSIEDQEIYKVTYISSSKHRGYAIAIKRK